MRHHISQISIVAPECPHCETPLNFTHTADVDRSGKVYMIFTCPRCQGAEMKFWRPEWQQLTDFIVAEEL